MADYWYFPTSMSRNMVSNEPQKPQGFWGKLASLLFMLALLAAVWFAASWSRASDCVPFFRSYSHRAAFAHQGYSHHAYPHRKFVQEFYYSAGPFVERKAALAYEKATDPDWREFSAFQQFKAEYGSFQEYREAIGRTPNVRGQVMANKCASCHSGDAAEKGLVLDGVQPIDPGKITAALKRIRDNTMPPNGGLSDEDKAALMSELLTMETPSE